MKVDDNPANVESFLNDRTSPPNDNLRICLPFAVTFLKSARSISGIWFKSIWFQVMGNCNIQNNMESLWFMIYNISVMGRYEIILAIISNGRRIPS